MNKELKELMYGAGYVAGEVTEITKDGLGFEDLKSLKDLVENREIITEMKVEGEFKAMVEKLDYTELVKAVMEFHKGMTLGLS